MQYRRFGPLDWRVSALGFGAMRLPVIDNTPSHIDEPEAVRMIRRSIDEGINYVDTAYPYHGGNSERFVGRALQDGYRDKVKLATKLPSFLVKSREDMDRYLNAQLKRLATDQIDYYLVHTLSGPLWETVLNHGVMDFLDKAKADGRIDAKETERLVGKMREDGVTDEEQRFVMEEIRKPMDTDAIVRAVPNQQVAAQIYTASLMAIEVDTDIEKRYLQELASKLGLNHQVLAYLHQAVGVA